MWSFRTYLFVNTETSHNNRPQLAPNTSK
jgi:hypothetical protein